MSNFFVRKRNPDAVGDGGRHKKQGKFQKRSEKSTTLKTNGVKKRRRSEQDVNEEIVSSESDYDEMSAPGDNVGGGEEEEALDGDGHEIGEEETAQQTKLRLAKAYIDEVREKVRLGLASSDRKRVHEGDSESGDESEAVNDEEALVSLQLRKENAIKTGQLHKSYAKQFTDNEPKETARFRGHKNCITCGCLSSDGRELYTGAKDCSIIKWSLEKNCKIWMIKGQKKSDKSRVCHKGQINSIDISEDSKFLASAGKDSEVFIWNPENGTLLTKLKGHQSSVMCVKFGPQSYQLFSSSSDRFVKIWQVDDEILLDNLCGHEGTISAVDIIEDNPITCGGVDKTIRLWKVALSSQLVFVHSEYVDCVLYLNSDTFATGDCSGCVCLWSTRKKKPIFRQSDAHAPNWVASLSSVRSSDVMASGSCSGSVNIWKVVQFEKLSLIRSVHIQGFINFILFTPDVTKMLLGVSNENKLGRFEVIQNCKNSIVVYSLTDSD